MKRASWIFVAVSLLIGAPALAADRTFDNRAWSVGYEAGNDEQHLTEYVVQPETVEAWSELVTNQVVFDSAHRLELSRLLSLIKGGFGPDCKDLKWTILEKTDSAILYEWSHAGCAQYPPQYEVSLLSTCDAGICRWAYSSKRVPVDDSSRANWRQIIKGLTVNAQVGP